MPRKKSTHFRTTRKKYLQRIWHDYERIHGTEINDPEMVAAWALETGRYDDAPPSMLQRCKKELKNAIRDEYITDAKGRDVRLMHAVPKVVGEQTIWEWGRIYSIPPEGMRASLARRRSGILADCRQHEVDTESYNDFNKFGAQLPLFDYNFQLDLDEEKLAGDESI